MRQSEENTLTLVHSKGVEAKVNKAFTEKAATETTMLSPKLKI